MKTIQEFQIDERNDCKHLRTKNSKGFENLSISFCVDCGVNIITYYGQENQRTFYIYSYDVWKLFNSYFKVMK